MKSKRIFLLLVCVGLISVLFTAFAYQSYFVKAVKTTPIRVSVTVSTVGFDVTTERMDFGQVPRGGSGEREVSIGNNDLEPVRIQIKVKGDLADWLGVSDNLFILEPDESRQITTTLNVPNNVELAQYTGELFVYYLRP